MSATSEITTYATLCQSVATIKMLPMSQSMTYAQWIKRERKKHPGLTQEMVADRAGMGRTQYVDLERGQDVHDGATHVLEVGIERMAREFPRELQLFLKRMGARVVIRDGQAMLEGM